MSSLMPSYCPLWSTRLFTMICVCLIFIYRLTDKYCLVYDLITFSFLSLQTCVMRQDFTAADQILPTIPKEHRNRVAHFLEKQGWFPRGNQKCLNSVPFSHVIENFFTSLGTLLCSLFSFIFRCDHASLCEVVSVRPQLFSKDEYGYISVWKSSIKNIKSRMTI